MSLLVYVFVERLHDRTFRGTSGPGMMLLLHTTCTVADVRNAVYLSLISPYTYRLDLFARHGIEAPPPGSVPVVTRVGTFRRADADIPMDDERTLGELLTDPLRPWLLVDAAFC